MSQFPDDLIAQADMLLRAEKRKPKQASLRRAVSAAYYALFHFLIEEATIFTVGTSGASKSLRQLVGRGFSHTAMRSASAEMGKLTPSDLLKPFWPQYGVAASTELQKLAKIFVALQQERHRADYDLSQPFTRNEAEKIIEQARDAIAQWNSLRTNDRELARFYALCLLNWNNWKAR